MARRRDDRTGAATHETIEDVSAPVLVACAEPGCGRDHVSGAAIEGSIFAMRVEEGPLRTYLQAHVASSHAGEQIAIGAREQTEDAATRDFLSSFIEQVKEERGILEGLLEEVGDGSLLRRGLDLAADIVAKAGRVAEAASPGLFAELEALAVGVWSKRLLWGTLRSLADVDETFRSLPVDELSDRADRQEMELLRLRQDAIIPSLSRPERPEPA